MSFLDSLERYNVGIPTDEEYYETQLQRQTLPPPPDPADYRWEWQKEFDNLRYGSLPMQGGYVSPYEGSGWGGAAAVYNNLERLFEAAVTSEKVDPNKIFTSDIAQLKTIAADQAKIVRLFEARFKEGLTEKGKVGLTETDIEALQALTAARGAITAISKEQVNIKKNIAELKIKQQQAENGGGRGNSNSGGSSGLPSSVYDVGRSIMDNIFNTSLPATAPVGPVDNVTDVSIDGAGELLDTLVQNPSEYTKYEVEKVKPVVVVGNSDSSAEYVAMNSTGEIVPDYPLPTTNIKTIDREAEKAIDDIGREYKLITKTE